MLPQKVYILPHITPYYPTLPQLTQHYHSLVNITTDYPILPQKCTFYPHITLIYHKLLHITQKNVHLTPHYPILFYISTDYRLPYIATDYPLLILLILSVSFSIINLDTKNAQLTLITHMKHQLLLHIFRETN